MTIHSQHPFATPAAGRDQLRRFRGRLASPVTIWATQSDAGRRVGLTISSMLVAIGSETGEPGLVMALIDPLSDLYDSLRPGRGVAVSLLAYEHRRLADAMAGVAPAPGGPFRLAEWEETAWGPALHDSPGWLGAKVVGDEPAGRSRLVRAEVEKVQIGVTEPVSYLQGRYRSLA